MRQRSPGSHNRQREGAATCRTADTAAPPTATRSTRARAACCAGRRPSGRRRAPRWWPSWASDSSTRSSALGLGMACGPLLGAILGDLKWRYPFFGTAALMAIGFLAITVLLKEQPKPARKTSLLDPLKALAHGGLAPAAVSAFFHHYAFFTVPAFTPFVRTMSPCKSGVVFFSPGVCCSRSSR
ncbi:MFS transporter [Streptomyces sp. SF28]|nr:MFS transporter [Streptomyces pinistramenti]MCB5912086.1 MFS transporter [Streptomyces pinistramenti]